MSSPQWLKLNLGSLRVITGVVTQPRYNTNHVVRSVTQYDVEYSLDDAAWVNLGTFFGPTPSDGPNFEKYNYFPDGPVLARYVKFVVVQYYHRIHMRADVIVRTCTCGASEEQTAAGCVSASDSGSTACDPAVNSTVALTAKPGGGKAGAG